MMDIVPADTALSNPGVFYWVLGKKVMGAAAGECY